MAKANTVDINVVKSVLGSAIRSRKDKSVQEILTDIAVKIDEHLFKSGKVDSRGDFSNHLVE